MLKLFIYLFFYFFLTTSIINSSGGYTNGTATGKGYLDIDLTWNPFNYWPQGQSYAVISYGLTNNFDIFSYYSIPVKGSRNYYLGFFYQFYKNKFIDLATAIGIRQYIPKSENHIFFPQLLYTYYLYNNIRIGGSFVNIKNYKKKYVNIGTTLDIALIIPIIPPKRISYKIIDSFDFTIGAFRPALWKPDKRSWHPTYSFDIKIAL